MRLQIKLFSILMASAIILLSCFTGLSQLVDGRTRNTAQDVQPISQVHIQNRLREAQISQHSSPIPIPVENKIIKKPIRTYAAFHTVEKGDTLWKLSVQNHISVSSLMEVNHLHTTVIQPGQKLCVYLGSQTAWQKLQLQKYKHSGIPLKLIPVYQAAGRKFGIPWTVLAAIHREETHFSTGKAVSYAGAEGPMQFMPSTFRCFGVCAPGHSGTPDINNVYDAIYTCAHMLKAEGYQEHPTKALFAYNHSLDYVRAVQSVANTYGA